MPSSELPPSMYPECWGSSECLSPTPKSRLVPLNEPHAPALSTRTSNAVGRSVPEYHKIFCSSPNLTSPCCTIRLMPSRFLLDIDPSCLFHECCPSCQRPLKTFIAALKPLRQRLKPPRHCVLCILAPHLVRLSSVWLVLAHAALFCYHGDPVHLPQSFSAFSRDKIALWAQWQLNAPFSGCQSYITFCFSC